MSGPSTHANDRLTGTDRGSRRAKDTVRGNEVAGGRRTFSVSRSPAVVTRGPHIRQRDRANQDVAAEAVGPNVDRSHRADPATRPRESLVLSRRQREPPTRPARSCVLSHQEAHRWMLTASTTSSAS